MGDHDEDYDHDTFTDHGHDESNIIDTLLNCDSQPEITDSQFNDDDMYHLIKTSFGQLDRKTFKLDLMKHTDTNDLRPIRTSLFDLVKKQQSSLNDTKLVERTQRDNGQPISDKLADDIYILFQYLEGANNVSELKQCISKSKRRPTASENTYDSQQVLSDVIQKLSKKAICKNTDNSVIIALILEVKQMINDSVKPLNDKIDALNESFQREIKTLKNELKHKQDEVLNLTGQLSETREKATKLQAEVKLKNQQLKLDEQSAKVFENQTKMNERITGHLETIKKQMKTQSDKSTKTYSETVSAGTDENENPIPVIINSRQQAHNNSPTNVSHDKTVQEFAHVSPMENNEYEQNDGEDVQFAEDAFQGVVRKRTKRIVLYNVAADKPYQQVSRAVRAYVEREGAHVTFTKLLKKRESKGRSTYIMRVNINEDDYYQVIDDNDYFWPKGIYWRDYVPQSKNQDSNTQWG